MEHLKINQDILKEDNKNFDNKNYISPRYSNSYETKPDYQLYAHYTSCSLRVYFMFDELNVPYQDNPINIRMGDNFKGEFGEITPNNKIPILIDNTIIDEETNKPLIIFESGAILLYLSEKHSDSIVSLPSSIYKAKERSEIQQWLIWNVSEFGPSIAQYVYYYFFQTQPNEYGMNKSLKNVLNAFNVLNKRLENNNNHQSLYYLCNNKYSIADIAFMGWGCFLYLGIIPELYQFKNIVNYIDNLIKRPTYQKFLPAIIESLKIRKLKRVDTGEFLIKN